MMDTRLSLAIERDELALPDHGPLLIVNAPSDRDWSFLENRELVFVQGFAPDYELLSARGLTVVPELDQVETTGFSAAIVFMPKARDLGRYWIGAVNSLIAEDGLVFVEGSKTEGIDACLKWCKKSGAQIGNVYSKAHGKVFPFSGGEFEPISYMTKTTEGFHTRLGVFSSSSVDSGSAALAAVLPDNIKGRVADLGAGWGYLSAKLLSNDAIVELHLVEAEYAALEAAKQNVSDARAHFHWADATTFSDSAGFDHIVCNPPFHKGRAAEPMLGLDFISAARRLVRPRGTVWLVANRHLPYEKQLTTLFAEVSELSGPSVYKLFRLSKPKKAGKR